VAKSSLCMTENHRKSRAPYQTLRCEDSPPHATPRYHTKNSDVTRNKNGNANGFQWLKRLSKMRSKNPRHAHEQHTLFELLSSVSVSPFFIDTSRGLFSV